MIYLLISSLVISCIPPTLYANQNDIMSVAGVGTSGYSGDGGPAISAELWSPGGVAVDSAGNIYISDNNNYCVRRVDASGIINTITGLGVPRGVAVDDAGNLYVAAEEQRRIFKDAGGSINELSTVTPDYMFFPSGVAVDSDGNQIYFADRLTVSFVKWMP
jgi:DNA-binding beta-propeller fold protein YncE